MQFRSPPPLPTICLSAKDLLKSSQRHLLHLAPNVREMSVFRDLTSMGLKFQSLVSLFQLKKAGLIQHFPEIQIFSRQWGGEGPS
jgi:hypothetical protein